MGKLMVALVLALSGPALASHADNSYSARSSPLLPAGPAAERLRAFSKDLGVDIRTHPPPPLPDVNLKARAECLFKHLKGVPTEMGARLVNYNCTLLHPVRRE